MITIVYHDHKMMVVYKFSFIIKYLKILFLHIARNLILMYAIFYTNLIIVLLLLINLYFMALIVIFYKLIIIILL